MHSATPVSVCSSGVSMPISRTRSSRPPISMSIVSPSITRSTTPTSGGNDAASSPLHPVNAATTATAAVDGIDDGADSPPRPDAMPDRQEVVDRLVEVVVDGDVGDPLDVESGARPDLQVTPPVVGASSRPPCQERWSTSTKKPSSGMPRSGWTTTPGAISHGMLARQRRKASGTHRPLQAQLVVGIDRSSPHLAAARAPRRSVVLPSPSPSAQPTSVSPQRGHGEVAACDALLDQRLEVVGVEPRCCVERGSRR